MSIIRSVAIVFGIFIMGGSLCHLPRIRVRNDRWALAVAIAAIIGFIAIDRLLPYTLWAEAIVFVAGSLAASTIFRLMASANADRLTGKPGEPSAVPIYVLAPVLTVLFLGLGPGILFSASSRDSFTQRLEWGCDGRVVDKYHSHNHGARTMVVQEADGASHTFEGIDGDVYERVQLGDQVMKRVGERRAAVNGREVELFEPRRWTLYGD
jgi:hypothetical protein